MRRREDPRLLTGSGRFVDDHRPRDCAAMAVLRSPVASAAIRSLDLDGARRAPGVLAVLAARDLGPAGRRFPVIFPHPGLRHPVGAAPLARDRVTFVGEPVAVVVAERASQAADALERIRVDWAPGPAAVDPEAALAPGAPLVHPDLGTNEAGAWSQTVGDPAAAFRRAEVRVTVRLRIERGLAQPLETRGVLAWATEGHLTVVAGVQAPHRHRRLIAAQLGLPEEAVRVIAPRDVGGAFGAKGALYPEDVLVPYLALRLGRPVKWIEERREHALATYPERGQVHEVEVAAARDGRLLGLRDRFVHDLGAATPAGLIQPQNTAAHLAGSYRVPSLDVAWRAALTHTTPGAAYRGAGRPQGVFVVERALDALARELGLDPLVVRERNLLPREAHPHDTGIVFPGRGPVVYDGGDFPRCQRTAAAALGWEAARRQQAAARAAGRFLGLGLANYVEATGTPPWEGARVDVDAAGRVVVATGAAPQGQGHETTLAAIVAGELALPPDAVTVLTGDTAHIPLGVGTFGSRTASLAGSAALLAARAVRDRARRIAAHLLEAAPADVECRDGALAVRGAPARQVTWAQVGAAARAGIVPGERPGLEATEYATVARSSFASGAHAALVEVDPETGAVRILRYVVVHDCGRLLDPALVEGQIHGGVAQGIGGSLAERLVYDAEGQLLTATLMDYAVPTAPAVPPLEIHHIETPTPLNPLGAKGAGEGGVMPVYALMAQAVEDALAPFGARVDRLPLTTSDIRRLVQGAPAGRGPA